MSAIDSQLPSSSGQDRPTDEVDRILSPGKLIILGLQHVLVMYAGAVAVPLMIGDRLGLSKEAIAMLISSDLFCCGIVTLLQCIGIGRFMGIRLPVIMSVTFAAVTPMIAIGMNPDIGLLGIFGATIAAGFITTRHWLPVWLLLLSDLASFRWVLTGPQEVKGIRNMVIPFI